MSPLLGCLSALFCSVGWVVVVVVCVVSVTLGVWSSVVPEAFRTVCHVSDECVTWQVAVCSEILGSVEMSFCPLRITRVSLNVTL